LLTQIEQMTNPRVSVDMSPDKFDMIIVSE